MEPLVGSSSAVRIFMNVDYRRRWAGYGVAAASHKGAGDVLKEDPGPKRMEMLLTESISF